MTARNAAEAQLHGGKTVSWAIIAVVAVGAALLALGCTRGQDNSSPFPQSEIKLRFAAGAIAFSPTHQHLAAGTIGKGRPEGGLYDGYLQVFDWSTAQELHCLSFDRWVNTLAYSPDGKHLAVGTGSYNVVTSQPNYGGYEAKPGELAVFETPDCKEIKRLRFENNEGCWNLQFTPDGRRLVVARAGRLFLYDARSLDVTATYPYKEELYQAMSNFAISPDGKHVAVSAYAGLKVVFYELSTGKYERTLDLPSNPALGPRGGRIFFAPDGKSLLVGSQFWNVDSGTAVTGAYKTIGFEAMSANGKLLAATGYVQGSETFSRIQLADLAGDVTVWKLFDDKVAAMAFSPDGKLLAAGIAQPFNAQPHWPGAVILYDISKKAP